MSKPSWRASDFIAPDKPDPSPAQLIENARRRLLDLKRKVVEQVEQYIDAEAEETADSVETGKRELIVVDTDEGPRWVTVALCRVKEFLARFGAEGRFVLRDYAGSELKTIAANKELPPGASPIPSIEFERKGALQAPKTTTSGV